MVITSVFSRKFELSTNSTYVQYHGPKRVKEEVISQAHTT